MNDSSEAERIASHLAGEDDRSLAVLRGRAPSALGIRDRWLLESLEADDDRLVERHSDSFYALPAHASKILSKRTFGEIRELLSMIRSVNDELAETRALTARTLISYDDRVNEVRSRLRAWAADYVAERMAKPNARDASDPVARFQRLQQELVPDLERIAFEPASIHSVFLSELTDHIPWLIFRATWSGLLEFEDGSELELRSRFRIRPMIAIPDRAEELSPRIAGWALAQRSYCEQIVQLYGWERADDLHRVVRILSKSAVLSRTFAADGASATLRALSADLLEMRPVLIGGANAAKTIVEVAPGLFISWIWAGRNQALGQIPVAGSERQMLEHIHRRSFYTMLSLDQEGSLAPSVTPWIESGSILSDEPAALAVNVLIAEAIHQRLFEIYEKIDLAAVQRFARDAVRQGSRPVTAKDVAIACQIAAREDTAQSAPSPKPRSRIPVLRMERLLALLSDRLGCEVRQGKGSEVVIYRAGGRIVRLGRHVRNREVPSVVVKSAIERLGISFAEWISALE
jgi:hypothetical protein